MEKLEKKTIKRFEADCIRVPTHFIPRESTQAEKSSENQRQNYYQRYKHMLEMNHNMNVICRDSMLFCTREHRYSQLLKILETCGILNSYLYLYDHPLIHRRGETWNVPKNINLLAYQKEGTVYEVPNGGYTIRLEDLYRNPFLPDTSHSYVLIDLYCNEHQYGILICALSYENLHYVELLCYQLSISLKFLELLQSKEQLLMERETMLQQIELENAKLNAISTIDELTGVWNRRGLLQELNSMFCNHDLEGHKAVMIYADLNYLKQINDIYGHEEGDYAIRTCGKVLASTVQKRKGLIGRIGGDEFAGCILTDDSISQITIKNEIEQLLLRTHQAAEKPYCLTLSIGLYPFTFQKGITLLECMKESDKLLYHAKQNKPLFYSNIK